MTSWLRAFGAARRRVVEGAMSDAAVDPTPSVVDPDGDRLPALFVLGVALVAILLSAVVTLALVASLQGA